MYGSTKEERSGCGWKRQGPVSHSGNPRVSQSNQPSERCRVREVPRHKGKFETAPRHGAGSMQAAKPPPVSACMESGMRKAAVMKR